MGRRRLLSEKDLAKARAMRIRGFTKNEIAQHFNVGVTTIWDNIYSTQQRTIKKNNVKGMRYRDLQVVIGAICLFKKMEYNSNEASKVLEIPLEEVNYIWGHFS